MHRRSALTRPGLAVLAGAVSLVLQGAVQAHPRVAERLSYSLRPIVKGGDAIGSFQLRASATFYGAALSDTGQVAFYVQGPNGGVPLVLYSGGTLTPLTPLGGEAPGGGVWSEKRDVFDIHQVSMNRSGSFVFPGMVKTDGKHLFRTFAWDASSRSLSSITLPGMPAGSDLTVAESVIGAINNRNEIVVAARTRNVEGKDQPAILRRSPEGEITTVATMGQALPGGRTIQGVGWPSINDAGTVAFIATRKGDTRVGNGVPESAYVWDKGNLSATVELGSAAPGGGKIAHIWYVLVNNANENVMVQAILDKPWTGLHGLYMLRAGQLVAVAAPGQEMPGGGQLKGLRAEGVSLPNDRGQHVFVADIREAGQTLTALYRVDAAGRLSLVLKSGAATELGTISRLGPSSAPCRSIALNNKGQIVLPVKFAGLPEMLVVLTPSAF